MIRVELPYHLRNLAQVSGEVKLEVASPVTIAGILDALEARYPVLRGTIRDYPSLHRRPFLRFFACEQDFSLEPPQTPLPEAVAEGREPFLVVGAIAGGRLRLRPCYRIAAMRIAILLLAAALAMPAAGWKKLFDGKSLKGFSIHSGTATYRVEKGEIVGTAVLGSPNTFLCTDKQYKDFILEFEVKVGAELNSGVQIRSLIAAEEMTMPGPPDKKGNPRKIPKGRVYGYQVEIAPTNPGRIYDEARRAVFLDNPPLNTDKTLFKPNEWNKYRIEARGDSIKTWVNGVPTADLKDGMTAAGTIGLQVHQVSKEKFQPYEVRWRNLRIQEL